MAIGLGSIFGIASSVLGSRSSSGTSKGMTAAEAMAAIDFEEYKRTITKPQEAVPTKIGAVTQYSDLLNAWDDYLNNEYLELSKRILG